MHEHTLVIFVLILGSCQETNSIQQDTTGVAGGYKIRHTGVSAYYDTASVISNPGSQSVFALQDANSYSASDNFIDHGDGTITDVVTGLMWTKNLTPRQTLEEARVSLSQLNAGRYQDWRIPGIKELYSLIDYSGRVFGDRSIRLFINTTYFDQPLGNTASGEREIDAQTWSSTECLSLTMGKDRSRYGVNFVDGRIKAYPITEPFSGTPNKLYFRFVRGNRQYGYNKFTDNQNGTITDEATGLMWQQADSKVALDWKSALTYADGLNLANQSDWRLPTIKELQSLVVYENQVDATRRASISPLFQTSSRNNPDGSLNFPYFWSSTTLLDGPQPGNQAAYVCFGKASAFFNGQYVDAHGTGAVRSDSKYMQQTNYPIAFGPQGDLVYVKNYVRCVRNVK
jgi:hypothetical protein